MPLGNKYSFHVFLTLDLSGQSVPTLLRVSSRGVFAIGLLTVSVSSRGVFALGLLTVSVSSRGVFTVGLLLYT